jgi:uncharacterized protein (UPF0261 family)
VEGGVFHDPVADRALVESVKAILDPAVEVHEIDADINDPRFARAMAARLDEMIQARQGSAMAVEV